MRSGEERSLNNKISLIGATEFAIFPHLIIEDSDIAACYILYEPDFCQA